MSLYDAERALRAAGVYPVCGVDEAGRGPLAGRVYAAAVILPEDVEIEGLNDSKKLSEKKRESLFDEIVKTATAFAVAYSSVEEIERLNILGAAMLAMNRAIEALDVRPALALIDGNRAAGIDCPTRCIVGGDASCACIAAASILAKVTRDRYMLEQAELYPQYGFDRHKGYGTKLHYAALREYGPCPIHRPSFLKRMH